MPGPIVKSVAVKISTTGVDDARLQIEKIRVKAEELGREHPTITPQIDKAKALLEARLLRDGIKRELAGSLNIEPGKLSAFQRMVANLRGGSNGSGGLASMFASDAAGGGSMFANPAAIAGIAASAAVLLPEITGLVSGFAAATAGVGAFGLLALPTFDKIKNAYTTIDAAQKKYNQAEALYKESPTKTNATAAASALLKLRTAQESMAPSTRAAVGGIHALVGEFDKMARAFQPTVMKVFNDGLKIANDLLPHLTPLAQAAGTAIDGLLKRFDKFIQSKGFKDWLSQFTKLIGPSITAIGTGIGKITIAFGKLLTVMSSRSVVHTINVAFGILSGTIDQVTFSVKHLMRNWHLFQDAVGIVIQWVGTHFIGLWKTIIDGAAKAASFLPFHLGQGLQDAAKAFDRFAAHANASLNSLTAPRNVYVYEHIVSPQNAGAAPSHRAAGGPASGLILVGERGPELLQVPPSSYVYTNTQTQAMMSGRGGITIQHLSVNLPHGSDREQGRRIVDAIRRYEQGSGHSWRK
jgi:hypothetical protein